MKKINKNILITTGPTWVPIDKVRVISNIASGETGFLLAKRLNGLGAKVTLLLGPVEQTVSAVSFKLLRFRFFDELKEALLKELNSRKYDIVIHTAAVSDYKLKRKFNHKVASEKKYLKLELAPTIKLINLIKKVRPEVFLVGFKFEPGKKDPVLLNEARKLISESGVDLAVANSIDNGGYRAYIVGRDSLSGPFKNKKAMVDGLTRELGMKICEI